MKEKIKNKKLIIAAIGSVLAIVAIVAIIIHESNNQWSITDELDYIVKADDVAYDIKWSALEASNECRRISEDWSGKTKNYSDISTKVEEAKELQEQYKQDLKMLKSCPPGSKGIYTQIQCLYETYGELIEQMEHPEKYKTAKKYNEQYIKPDTVNHLYWGIRVSCLERINELK